MPGAERLRDRALEPIVPGEHPLAGLRRALEARFPRRNDDHACVRRAIRRGEGA